MTTLEYWEEREKAHAAQTKLEDDVLAKRIRDRLDVLMVDMNKQINGFYSRYAKAEGITMAEAQQRVSKMDVKAFETKAAKYVKDRDFSKQANDELRLYNATMKINRLEMLKAEMGLEMVDAFEDVEGMMTEGLTQRTLDEFERQAGILGVDNKDMTGKVDSIVNGSLNNATWSQRIWMYQGMLKNSLADLLTNGIIQGKNPRELARDLVKTFGVTKSNAERLMRTEMCRVQIGAQMASFHENGYEQFVFISTEDSRVCAVCNSLNGEIFKVKDHTAGENAPPMHPNCRCSTAAFMDRAELEKELAKDSLVQTGGKEETGGKRYAPYDETDPREIAAAKEYKKISKRNDVQKIADSSGMTVEEIQQIKRHIFYNKHQLYDGYKMLYPDYDMAVAWKRLFEGNPEPRDFLLLKHELLESIIEKEYNLTIAEAHRRAKQVYDWEAALLEAVGDFGEPDGLL